MNVVVRYLAGKNRAFDWNASAGPWLRRGGPLQSGQRGEELQTGFLFCNAKAGSFEINFGKEQRSKIPQSKPVNSSGFFTARRPSGANSDLF